MLSVILTICLLQPRSKVIMTTDFWDIPFTAVIKSPIGYRGNGQETKLTGGNKVGSDENMAALYSEFHKDTNLNYKKETFVFHIALYPAAIVYKPVYDRSPYIISLRKLFEPEFIKRLIVNHKNKVVVGSSSYWSRYQYVWRSGTILNARNHEWLMSVLINGRVFKVPDLTQEKNIVDFALSVRPARGDLKLATAHLLKVLAYERTASYP